MSAYPVHIEVLPRVHLIRGANNARFPEANSLLIDDEKLTLVDAGANKGHILKTLQDLGYSVGDLSQIILTHFHIDHKGYAAELQSESGCELLCHPLADRGVSTFEGMVEYYGIGTHRFYEGWKKLLSSRLPHVTEEYNVTGHFTDGEKIRCGETSLIALHAPGHTIDHTLFGINDFETIFLVDIDLTRFGPWYGNAVSNIQDFKNSIRKVIDLRPRMGISSHLLDVVTDDLHTRLETFLGVFDFREAKILASIKEGHDTLEKLAALPTIYPRIPYDVYVTFEEFMLEKHITDLETRGLLSTDNGRLILTE
jgi:glyoxylase-like metal-dependent hydrolase (beta-lactamase superfamily II)